MEKQSIKSHKKTGIGSVDQVVNRYRLLLKVDEHDQIQGKLTWDEAHKGNGVRHRAITILLLNKQGKLLITKRSQRKKLWPNIWESSCSTHVLYGDIKQGKNSKQAYIYAGTRRLVEELGVSCGLTYAAKFSYQATYEKIGSENEICALLVGRCDGKITPNPKEVADYEWLSLDELKEQIKRQPEKYAPWLKLAIKKYENYSFDLHDYTKDQSYKKLL